MTKPFIIAIDGPAASGKGTLSRKLSEACGLPHLDTGLTYRAVANALLENDQPMDNETIAVEAAKSVDLSALDKTVLARHTIGEAASKVAVMSKVRAALVEQQRLFANTMPGAVLDGRDIGTVVCPEAQVKLYVIASPEVRAKRRWQEIAERGILSGKAASYEQILTDIKLRDERDMGRDDSPLKPAEDAHLLDTTEMDIETAFATALALVNKAKSA